MKIKVADYIINRLAQEGIKHVFVVYGAANGDLIDAFTRNPDIKYVCAQHEQGAGFMAEGYQKAGARFGCAIATSGPGGMNFVTPIGNCFYDSVPCLFLTGQVKTQFMRKDEKIRQVGFQETDIAKIVEPITKWSYCIKDPKEVVWALERAFYIMNHLRPGPVLLDIPIDVQKATIDVQDKYYDFFSSSSSSNTNPLLDKLIADISKASRPYLLVGGGARDAIGLIKELSYKLSIPASPTYNALDLVTSDWDTYAGRVGTYGGASRNFGIQNCDLLICVGTRISGRITGGKPETFARGAKKWVIDIDPNNYEYFKEQGIKVDEFICEYSNIFFKRLLNKIKDEFVGASRESFKWNEICKYWVNKYDPVKIHQDTISNEINPYLFVRELSNQMSKDDIFVVDCGGNLVISNHAFKTKQGQRYFTNNGNSPMGFSMCGAIGAWFYKNELDYTKYDNASNPTPNNKLKGNIVCLIGDGGMQMNIQELQTIKNYDVNIKIIILNNAIYGITKAYQKVNFEGRSEACEAPHYTVPNFKEIGDAYLIGSYKLNRTSKWKEFLSLMLSYEHAQLVEVMCDDWHSYLPKVSGWDQAIEDMEPYLSNEEFLSNMIIKITETSQRRRGL